eukprot:CAMPEP_0172783144 /NCGR_PEP_ID=MMETSP1074-20121228/204288_1 /TAXON_ID=2916 /ORGANISM="Ceratium fusus, Strain PA161109" /LENGTH=54 /DNA_ID=CAMNT_0013620131 /DNA_START=1544 /DNA_END=1708 /DNA_ORIENTATION=+
MTPCAPYLLAETAETQGERMSVVLRLLLQLPSLLVLGMGKVMPEKSGDLEAAGI